MITVVVRYPAVVRWRFDGGSGDSGGSSFSDTAVAVGSILRLRLGLGNTVTVWAGSIL